MLLAQATNNFNLNFESQTLLRGFMQWVYLRWGTLIIWVLIFLLLYFSIRWLVKYYLKEHEKSKKDEEIIRDLLLRKANKLIGSEMKMDLIGKEIDKLVTELDKTKREENELREKLDKISRLRDL